MYPEPLTREAQRLNRLLRQHNLKIVFAESCTGGLVSAALTEIPGISNVQFLHAAHTAKQKARGLEPLSEEAFALFLDEAHGNAGHRFLDGDARIHERERAAADRGHRA